jgi:WD40 repeat protein
LWNVADGKPIRSYNGCEDAVTAVTIIRDSARVLAASLDKQVRVWPFSPPTAASAAPPLTGAGSSSDPSGPALTLPHPAVVRGICVSADNSKVVTCSDDRRVRVYELASGRQVEFTEHAAAALAVAMAGDNRTVVSGAADGSVRVWTLAATRLIAAHASPIRDLALVAGGGQAATAGEDRAVRLWNLGSDAAPWGLSPDPEPDRCHRNPGTAESAGSHPHRSSFFACDDAVDAFVLRSSGRHQTEFAEPLPVGFEIRQAGIGSGRLLLGFDHYREDLTATGTDFGPPEFAHRSKDLGGLPVQVT